MSPEQTPLTDESGGSPGCGSQGNYPAPPAPLVLGAHADESARTRRKPTVEEAEAILTLVRGGWLRLELALDDAVSPPAPFDVPCDECGHAREFHHYGSRCTAAGDCICRREPHRVSSPVSWCSEHMEPYCPRHRPSSPGGEVSR